MAHSPVIGLLVWIFEGALRTAWLLLKALFNIAKWLCWRLIDILCAALWLTAVASGVRTPYSIYNMWFTIRYSHQYESASSTVGAFRACALLEFILILVDVPTYTITLLVYLSPWRSLKLHRRLKKVYRTDFLKDENDELEDVFEWRGAAWWQFWLWILDLFTIPFSIIVFLTVYRAPRMLSKINKARTDYKGRVAMVSEFLNILIDIPSIAMGIAMCCTWRIPFVLSRAHHRWNTDDVDERIWKLRALPWVEFVILLRDIPVIAATPILLVAPWRLLCVFKNIRSKQSTQGLKTMTDKRNFWREVSYDIITQAILVFIDLIVFVCAVVICCLGPWRIPHLYRAYTETNNFKEYLIFKHRWHFHKRTTAQLVLLALDLPCMVAVLIVLATVWRARPLIRELLRHREKDWEAYARHTAVTQCFRFFVDLALAVPLLVVLCTVWRAGPLIRSYPHRCKKQQPADDTSRELRKSETKDKDNRCFQDFVLFNNSYNITRHFLFIFFDIVLLMLTLAIYTTLWRALPLLKLTKKTLKKQRYLPESLDSVVCDSDAEIKLDLKTLDSEATKRKPKENPDFCFQDAIFSKNAKHICLQFVLLIVDTIAMPFGMILLVSWRSSKLISGLIGSGNFYAFFAVTIFMEFKRLLVDVPCIIWFLLMLILRPVGSIILLLEDARHRRARLLRQKLPELKYILSGRTQYLKNLDDVMDLALKHGVQPSGMSATVQEAPDTRLERYGDGSKAKGQLDYFAPLLILKDTTDEFLQQLEEHKLATTGLSERYTYLLTQLIAIERKRPRVMMRRYHLEFTFMCRPDPLLRNKNLSLILEEMDCFDKTADSAADDAANFESKTPQLWRSTTGFSSRSRSENQKVLMEIATTGYFAFLVLFVINCVGIYRVPHIVSELNRRWWKRHEILRANILAYFKDLAAFLCIILVTVGVYRALDMYGQIAIAILEHRSWPRARRAVFQSASTFGLDVLEILKLPFRWSTYSYTTLALLWGVLVPIDLLQPIFGMALAILIWIILTSFPFIFSTELVEMLLRSMKDSDFYIDVTLLSFIVLLLLVLIIATRSRFREGSYNKYCEYHFFRVNWSNINVITSEILEFIQTIALTLQLGLPMAYGNHLAEWSGYFLLSFVPAEVKFGIVVSIFSVWYFVASGPPVVEAVMHKVPEGRISSHILWKMAAIFLTETLFITMVEACLSMLQCTKEADLLLVSGSDITCWAGNHIGIAAFSLFAFMWYSITSHMYNGRYRFESSSHDIQFSTLLLALNNIFKCAMVAVSILLRRYQHTSIGLLTFINLLHGLLVFCFPLLTGYPACNSENMTTVRKGVCTATIWTSAAAVFAYVLNDANSNIPFYVMIGGWTAITAVVFSKCQYSELSKHQEGRKKAKKKILGLEESLFKAGSLLHYHVKTRQSWRWHLRHVRDAKWISLNEENELSYFQAINSDLCCPITMDVLVEPVRSPYGHVFERSAITRWIQENRTCPLTRQPLSVSMLENASDVKNKMKEEIRKAALEAMPVLSDSHEDLVDIELRVNKTLGAGRFGKPCAETSDPYEISNEDQNLGPKLASRTASYNEIINDGEANTNTVRRDIDALVIPPLGAPMDSAYYRDEEWNNSIAATHDPSHPYSKINDTIVGTTSTEDTFDGKSALLELEQAIRYNKLPIWFLAARDKWRNVVENSSWLGLVEAANILEAAGVVGGYAKPSLQWQIAAVKQDELLPDVDELILPPFVDFDSTEDIEEVRKKSTGHRQALLDSIKNREGAYSEQSALSIIQILDAILPVGLIVRWSLDDIGYSVRLADESRGKLKQIGPNGIKAAIGSNVRWKENFTLTLTSDRAGFSISNGGLRVSKGPISVVISKCTIDGSKLEVTYNQSSTKKVSLSKVLETLSGCTVHQYI